MAPVLNFLLESHKLLWGALSWPILLEDSECTTCDMAWVAVYLPHKHADLSLSSRTHIGSHLVAHVCNPSICRQRQEEPWGALPVSLVDYL